MTIGSTDSAASQRFAPVRPASPAHALAASLLFLCCLPLSSHGASSSAEAAERIAASRDDLFGDDTPKSKPAPATRDSLFGDDLPKDKPAKPSPRESLFGDDLPKKPQAKEPGTADLRAKQADPGTGWRGYF